ncbi:MAG: RagB/SusD family nutrient uptake outer membrane protein [Bacteroidia bacterium]|nr:RagB/SusD family nutrient uptake outer membrane protein [Bacteroidia bacterium]
MKKYFIIGFLFTGLISCKKDFLDKTPKSLNEESVWADINLAETYANNLYLGISNGFDRGCSNLSAISDEANGLYSWTEVERVNLGDYSAANAPFFAFDWHPANQRIWYTQFNYIRRCNVLLSKIDGVPGASEAAKNRLKGEALFLRALFYHDLTKFYGGVPYIKTVTTTEDISALQTPRNTYDECVNLMVADLDAAATALPEAAYKGRAVKASAHALKSRVLLYAKKYPEAAAAAKLVIDNSTFVLHPTYANLFKVEGSGSNEIIFSKQFFKGQIVHSVDLYNYPGSQGGGWSFTNPTQDFVDMYEMTDGKSITESPLYSATNPYANREPRFYQSIVHDNSLFGGATITTRAGGTDIVTGGGAPVRTSTGYLLRKFINENVKNELYSLGSFGASYNEWIVLRLGEVLLNYAEAKNEATGPDASVYDAVNRIRTRAGLPNLPGGLSQSQMRDKIRHERAIELAF